MKSYLEIDATDWHLNKEEGYIEFNHERFDCYAQALLNFITSFSNMCILASKCKNYDLDSVVAYSATHQLNVCLDSWRP